VITVCDKACETCPVWPGQPIIAHRGAPDPAEAQGTAEEVYRQFKQVALMKQRRVELFSANLTYCLRWTNTFVAKNIPV
jgi:hypothetical protein